MRTVYLAPSDLKYLFDVCPRCWWLKSRNIDIPKEVVPAVFREMDTSMKAAVSLEILQNLGVKAKALLPVGKLKRIIEFEELGIRFIINGYLDIAVELEDNSLAVYDFKVSMSSRQNLNGFARQIHCYLSVLEDPEGMAKEVTEIGLIVFSPDGKFDIKIAEGRVNAAQTGHLVLLPLDIDRAEFYQELEGVAKIAAGPMPQSGSTCQRCVAVSEIYSYITRSESALSKKAVGA